MKKQQARSSLDPAHKKRASIEFSPTLEKPIYIIARNLNGPHIIQLVDELDKHRIPYQMQQETQTLGFRLNQRFFVVVDNKYGEVSLGRQFGSILMTVVGYPRLGKHKNNKYFERPAQLVRFYESFRENRDISEQEKSMINKECCQAIVEKAESSSKLKSKIMMKSISKYKSLENESTFKNSLIGQCSAKLYVIQDAFTEAYFKLCEELNRLVKQELIIKLRIDEIKTEAVVLTNKVQVFYLVSQKHERQLLDAIFIGEVIVFNSETTASNFKSAFTQPKIYGVTSEKAEIIKMMQKIGLLAQQNSEAVAAQLPENDQICEDRPNNHLTGADEIKQLQKQAQSKPLLAVPQLGKIDAAQSVISERNKLILECNKQSELTLSRVSQVSAQSKKVKRIYRNKVTNDNACAVENEYFAGKNQTLPPKLQKHKKDASITSKIFQKSQQKQNIIQQKKSLKLVGTPEQQTKIKKIKSISKFQPKHIQATVQNNSTMTQNPYFAQHPRIFKPFAAQSQNRKSTQSSSRPSISTQFSGSKGIDAIFYRQFIHSFIQMTELIKERPSLFLQPSKYQFYQPFFNMTEFDRSAKRIKRKLKEIGHSCQELRFLVFLLEEQVPAFEKYCFEKNKYYEQQGYETEFINASDFSATFNSKKAPKLTIYLFIESSSKLDQSVANYGSISVVKMSFPAGAAVKPQSGLELILQKIGERSSKQDQNWHRLDKVYQS